VVTRIRRPARRLAGLAALAAGAAVVALLWWSAGSPVVVARELASPIPSFDRLVGEAAAGAAWVLLGWVGLAVAAEIAGALPGTLGRGVRRRAGAVTPRVVRVGVRWLLGVTLTTAPMLAAPAYAVSPAPFGPNLDRPVAAATLDRPDVQPATGPQPAASSAPAAASSAPAAASSAPAAASSAAAGASSARPAASPPVTPVAAGATRATSSTGPAAPVVTGTPHRDLADDGYVVRGGDCLWDIAARHLAPTATAADIAREWPRWYAANRAAIGDDPGLIRPGLVLHAPGT
jgi:nucleoid-associated protein YgaU